MSDQKKLRELMRKEKEQREKERKLTAPAQPRAPLKEQPRAPLKDRAPAQVRHSAQGTAKDPVAATKVAAAPLAKGVGEVQAEPQQEPKLHTPTASDSTAAPAAKRARVQGDSDAQSMAPPAMIPSKRSKVPPDDQSMAPPTLIPSKKIPAAGSASSASAPAPSSGSKAGGASDEGKPAPMLEAHPVQVDSKVRIKLSVVKPEFGWGPLDHQSIGVVTLIDETTNECYVDFPKSLGWKGRLHEIQSVEASDAPAPSEGTGGDAEDQAEAEEGDDPGSKLPAGFFDNPDLDAKARGQEAPSVRKVRELEEGLKRFEKEMLVETEIAEETRHELDEQKHEEVTAEEVEFQGKLQERLEFLRQQRERAAQRKAESEKAAASAAAENTAAASADADGEDSSGSDVEFDWRAKGFG